MRNPALNPSVTIRSYDEFQFQPRQPHASKRRKDRGSHSLTQFFAISGALLLLAAPVLADEVFNDDVIGKFDACFGFGCTDGEMFTPNFKPHLKLEGAFPTIEFSDTSTVFQSVTDWALRGNLGTDGEFALQDLTNDTTPFLVAPSAPTNSFSMASDGKVGLGTLLPEANLHIFDSKGPSLRLEAQGAETWTFEVGSLGMFLFEGPSKPVVKLFTGAPFDSLVVSADGNVGLGTPTPGAPLDVSSDANFSFFRLTAETAPINQSVDIVFTKGPDDRGQLRYNIVESGDAPQVAEMTLNADGDMVLTGTLTTTGPTCAAGCDAVFDAGYALASIEDHATFMFEAGHLPAIGPTRPGASVNLTEKVGNMLNELEHAHIYIAQQQVELSETKTSLFRAHAQLAEQEEQIADQKRSIEAVLERLQHMEATLNLSR